MYSISTFLVFPYAEAAFFHIETFIFSRNPFQTSTLPSPLTRLYQVQKWPTWKGLDVCFGEAGFALSTQIPQIINQLQFVFLSRKVS
jgi:hypothetical protein